jgi:hypothetical protein
MPRLVRVSRLLVAAGGGGDAIAAAMLASLSPGDVVGVATLAWDRLIVDPLPGPRSAGDFIGLEARGGYHLVTANTRPIPPAGSTLPRLAGELALPLVLLDPSGGAVGLRQQIAAAGDDLGATAIQLVDVGGDILGGPTDPTVRSPLADALTAASVVNTPATVLVAGPGLDGELPEAVVLERIGQRTPVYRLNAAAVDVFLPILEWHPSEATALLAAAARGLRGRVEIRDAGLPVVLTDHSPDVHNVPLAQVEGINPLVTALAASQALAEAEQLAAQVFGWTELDYERKKAKQAPSQAIPPDDTQLEAALQVWSAKVRPRGVEFVTFRRLAEVMGYPDVPALQRWLVKRWPEKHCAPIWDATRE